MKGFDVPVSVTPGAEKGLSKEAKEKLKRELREKMMLDYASTEADLLTSDNKETLEQSNQKVINDRFPKKESTVETVYPTSEAHQAKINSEKSDEELLIEEIDKEIVEDDSKVEPEIKPETSPEIKPETSPEIKPEILKPDGGVSVNPELKQPEKILQITDEKWRDKEANIVVVEDERKKREQNLLRLEKELENSRMDLVKMDLKKGKLWQRVAGFFKKDAGQLGEDKDVASMRDRYENSLKGYKSAFLEEAKRGNITEDEIGYILEYFDKDEKANLYDSRTEARLENAKGTKFEFIRENCAKAVNWYIELKPPKKKLAIGIALGAGAGAAAIAASFGVAGAGTVAGVLAAANMLKRVLGGAAFGVAADSYLDKRGENSRSLKSDKKVESFKGEVSELSTSEKIDKLNEFLENNASEVSKDLQKRKLGSLFKKSSAAVAGYLVGSGALFKGMMHSADFISDKTGLGEYVKDSEAGKWIAENSKWLLDKLHLGGIIGDPTAPEGADALSPDNAEALNPEAVAETGPASLIVEKGSSLEGSIINHLKANPDLLEKYNELHGGGRNFNAGAAAHRMALEFAEKNSAEFPDGPPSLIHPGAAINIDTEHMSIANVKDVQGMGYLPETPAPAEAPVVEAPTEKPLPEPWSQEVIEQQSNPLPVHEFTRNEITEALHDRFNMFSGTYDNLSPSRVGDFLEMKPGSMYTTGTPWEGYDYNEISGFQKSLQSFYEGLSPDQQVEARGLSVDEFIKKHGVDYFGDGEAGRTFVENIQSNAAEMAQSTQPEISTEVPEKVIPEAPATEQAPQTKSFPPPSAGLHETSDITSASENIDAPAEQSLGKTPAEEYAQKRGEGVSKGIEKTVDSARGAGSPREMAEKIVSMRKDISGGNKVRWDQIKNFTPNDFDKLQPFEKQRIEGIIAQKVQTNGISGRPMPGVVRGGQMIGGETLDQWARRVGAK